MTTTPEGAPTQTIEVPFIDPAQRTKLGIPVFAQVNLLPPAVIAKRKAAVVRRILVWVVLAVALICMLGFGGAFLLRADAEIAYEEAQAEADQLLNERREYSPVIQVLRDISTLQEARAYVLANEVNWTDYVYALAAVLPDGVTLDNISVASISAGSELQAGVDVLTRDAVGVITFNALSPTLPVASEWIDALESVQGLEDANLQSSQLQDDEGETYYRVTATIQVTDVALAKRTFADEDAVVGGDAGDNAEDGE